MTSQNFNSFYTRKKYFLEHSGYPPVVTFLAYFLSKRYVWKIMLMLLIFLHTILLEIVHNLSFNDNCVYLIDFVNNVLSLIYFIFIPIQQVR